MLSSQNILIVEDHPLFLSALHELLKNRCKPYSIFAFTTAEEAILYADKNLSAIQIIILDFCLPFLSGYSAIALFRKRFPCAKIVVLSGMDDINVANNSINNGASYFISKSDSIEKLSECIECIIRKKSFRRNNAPQHHHLNPKLTARQKQIVSCLTLGYSNKDISSKLCIAEITVKKHVSALFKIFNATNRNHLVIKIKSTGLTV